MIWFELWRVGRCEHCEHLFRLGIGDAAPLKCPFCGKRDWLYGPEQLSKRYARMGMVKREKVINPGAASKKRQEQGRKQYRQFRPKPE